LALFNREPERGCRMTFDEEELIAPDKRIA
jgi:hypothetical protein